MIVCDNIVFELQKAGGVSKYWSKTIERLDRSACDIGFLEGQSVKENIFRQALHLQKDIMFESGSLLFRRLKVVSTPATVFHSSYYRVSKKSKYNVVTIHDFMNEFFPTSFRDPLLACLKKRAIRAADRIVVVSECTKRDLLKYHRDIDPGIVEVIYNGADEEFFREPISQPFLVKNREINPSSYFLYVGTRGYCKNFPFTLRFFAKALNEGNDVKLILVGGGELNKSELRALAEYQVDESRIIQFHSVENNELRRLYSNTIALLIPSIYEGFGLPALEAARCGALVLASDGSALNEIVGKSDYLIDLQRPKEIERILRLGFDGPLAEAERERVMQRSMAFDWDQSAAKLLNVYDSLSR
jgi:mannosyltransferase